jgi:tetratricopeptide (TPR) repeat protein
MADKRNWQELCNQAWFARKRHDFQQAETLLLAAVKEVSTKPEDRTRLHETLNSLANVYAENGELAKALETAKHDVEVCRQLPGESHILLGSALMFFTQILMQTGQYATAIAAAEEGLAIYVGILGKNHSETLRMTKVLTDAQEKVLQTN